MNSNFIEINRIKIHYLDSGGDKPVMLMLHSLSANAHIFQGLIANGLSGYFRLILPDLRGRGQSGKMIADISLEAQAADLNCLIDHLQLTKVLLCGHSFGGFLAVYFAAQFPDRVSKLALLDMTVEMNPMTPALVSVSGARLFTTYPSWEVYLELVRKAPFINRWDAAMLPFLRHDVQELEDGTVVPSCFWLDAIRSGIDLFSLTSRDWYHLLSKIRCKAILVEATEPFLFGQFIITEGQAERTIASLRYCNHYKAEGNHLTMLFGRGARNINAALISMAGKVKKKKRVVA